MVSHTYQFKPRDLMLLLLAPVGFVVLFALLSHGAASAHLLPRPRPTFDTDQTILVHQAEASRRPGNATVLLVGDSSCLMDLAALPLGDLIGEPTLNLGTLSLLGLRSFGDLVEHYLQANPGKIKTVVLVLHPQALRRGASEARYVRFLNSFYRGLDDCEGTDIGATLVCQAGFESFRNRVVSRLFPSPLSGPYGVAYGFSGDLERYMTAHAGSVVEPSRGKFSGNPELWLNEQLEPASQAFRRVVPAPIKLAIAITPVPRSFAQPDYASHHQEILGQWGRWIEAEAVLTNLPATMPDENFANVTHLNETGMRNYTALMASELKRVLSAR